MSNNNKYQRELERRNTEINNGGWLWKQTLWTQVDKPEMNAYYGAKIFQSLSKKCWPSLLATCKIPFQLPLQSVNTLWIKGCNDILLLNWNDFLMLVSLYIEMLFLAVEYAFSLGVSAFIFRSISTHWVGLHACITAFIPVYAYSNIFKCIIRHHYFAPSNLSKSTQLSAKFTTAVIPLISTYKLIIACFL